MLDKRSAPYYLLLFILCIGTRLMTAVNYIADPDSLRFALALMDYDITLLQPHFPGYPVFCFVAKLFYLTFGSYALAFTVVGGCSLFLLILFSLKFVKARLDSPEGFLLVLLIMFNPMIWLMSNRYMPDLAGAAIAIGILMLIIRDDYAPERHLLIGLAMTGLLAGVRLSYIPLVILPALIAVGRSRKKVTAVLAFSAGVLIWLIPIIHDTGWNALVEAAQKQTAGHFTEFGGTIDVVPDIESRRIAVVKNVLADGLGGFWTDRAELTVLVTLGLILCFARGAWWLFGRETDGIVITVFCIIIYIAWILLYQNVVYQNRHVLPLLPILLYPVWAGGVRLFRSGIAGRIAVMLFLAAYSTVGIVIAMQQTEPTAIAQAGDYLRTGNSDDRVIISSPLVSDMLHGTGVEGTFLSVHIPADRQRFATAVGSGKQAVIVGWYHSLVHNRPDSILRFYHNPYVNSVWPEVPVSITTSTTPLGQ